MTVWREDAMLKEQQVPGAELIAGENNLEMRELARSDRAGLSRPC